ncbi:MAG: NAD(P)-dependent glycerol-3-phosphate dehydrogenase [Betaproteobacteria bacterium]|nr:NAD(P)-dependent glycerol-3-phosphate dehydrogenase [Betaproteobacteria bacterium]
MKIAVLGAGAWGTALAIALARHNRHALTLWGRDPGLCAAMRTARENPTYLPGQRFPETLTITADFPAALKDADLTLLAAPLAGFRTTLRRLRQAAPALPFLWVCKGLETGSGLLPHQVAAEETTGTGNRASFGVLTGPSFAEEVARGLPAAVTLASADADYARAVAQALSGPRLRVYASDDLIGAEVGGAVKNVMAIAAGISDGLGLGLNARAALITRGLAETVRFGAVLGAQRATFMGLAGMGDLILTCTGDLSRNRRVGLALAAGRPLAEITRELGHVAEGVTSAREISRRATMLGVDMPITQAVCAVLDGRTSAASAVEQLMGRDAKEE